MRVPDSLVWLTRWNLVAVLVVAAACGGGEEPSQAEAAELMNGGQEVADPARDFQLTMDNVRRSAQASENLMRRRAQDPAFDARVEMVVGDIEDAESLDEAARRMDADREVRRELEQAGMSPRDYLLTTMSITATGIYAGMRDMGWDGEPTEWVSQRNLDFYMENREEIERIMGHVRDLDRELFGDDDDW